MTKRVILLLCCFGISQAFLFWGSSGRQEAVSEIDRLCENKAENGDCGFYTCFDVRHPCERHNWALSYGWRYCSRFNQEKDRFTAEGKKWIEDSRKCTMAKMLEFYQDDHINCEDVEHAMKEAHAECEETHGVCEAGMLMDNREALMDVYKFSRRGLVRFLLFVKECTGPEIERFMDWITEHGTDGVESVLDLFRDIIS